MFKRNSIVIKNFENKPEKMKLLLKRKVYQIA
jgi:hypothetical protein